MQLTSLKIIKYSLKVPETKTQLMSVTTQTTSEIVDYLYLTARKNALKYTIHIRFAIERLHNDKNILLQLLRRSSSNSSESMQHESISNYVRFTKIKRRGEKISSNNISNLGQ